MCETKLAQARCAKGRRSCASGASWFKGKGRFKVRSYVPSPGDIIFFDWGAGVHHVGIVVEVKDGRIHGYGVYAS